MRNKNFSMFLRYLNLLVILMLYLNTIKDNLNFYSNENNNSIQIKSEYILGPGDNLNIYFEFKSIHKYIHDFSGRIFNSS